MNKKTGNIIFWVLVVAIAAFAVYSVFSSGKPQNGEGLAPDFTLTDLEGKTVKLSDYRGKVVFLNFWATWCPPCKAEMPGLDNANKELLKANKAVILAVNITDGVRDTKDSVARFMSETGYSLHVLLDQGGKVSDQYGVTGIPTTFIIDRDGKIQDSVVGPIAENEIMDYAQRLSK